MTRKNFNWDKPVHKRYRKETESINGGLPSGISSVPRPPQFSKERLRADGERAVAEWLAKNRPEVPKKKSLRRTSGRQCHD